MDTDKGKYTYSSFEKFSEIEYDEMIFSDYVKPKEKENFRFVKGKIISRGVINLKYIQFSDKAIKQSVEEFTPHPALAEHIQNLFGTVGTVVKYTEDNSGLNLYAIIPKTDRNKDFIELLDNDVANLIRLSIGGIAHSIKCSICGEEVYKDYDHMIGRKYKFKDNDYVTCYGIVDEWKTRESTFTIFPADTDTYQKKTKFSMNFSTGFNELDTMLDKRYSATESDTFINKKENRDGEEHMDNPNDKQTTPKVEVIQNDAKFDELKAMVVALSEKLEGQVKSVTDKVDVRFSQIDNANKAEKIVELTSLTKEKSDKYLEMSNPTIDALLDLARSNKKSSVPDEAGQVDGQFNQSPNMSKAMQKDALSIMLGFDKTFSEMSKEHSSKYGIFGESVEDKVNRILSVQYAPKE